jgi:uncharacterized protein (TIGR02246 family)
MKQSFIVIGMVCLAVMLFSSCAPEAETPMDAGPDIEADIQAQKDIVEKFDAALNSGDLEGFLDLYTEDAVRLPPGEEPILGKEALRTAIQQWFDQYEAQVHNVVVDARVSGDFGFARGTWEANLAPKDGGETMQQGGAWVSIHERQTDGSWKTIWEIWNLGSTEGQ